MSTGWQLGSLDLRTLAHEISTPDGWDSFPGFKGGRPDYIYQHGVQLGGRRFYQSRSIDLHVVFLDTDATGAVTTTPEQHLQANVEAFLRALHSSLNPLTLTRTMPDASVRTASVRPMDFIPVTSFLGLIKSAVAVLEMGYPFWHGASDSYVGGTGTVVNDGNAPINDMVITFTTTGRITVSSTGDYIESSEAGAVVNVGTGVITGADAGVIHSNRPWWIQLEPGNNGITVTGGNKTIAYHHAYF